MEHLIQDLRYGVRVLGRSPGFTTAAILTLAFGIGANTAIFSIVDAVILRPLPYDHADRLFVVHETVPKLSHIAPLLPVNGMHLLEWRKTTQSFEQLALVGGVSFNLTGSGEPERLAAARVSGSLFPMLGIRAQLGRTFIEEEDLLLARSALRRREIAIRSAMGASRGRLVRQMFVESLLVTAGGGFLGVVIADGAMRVILASAPADLPRVDEVHLDARVLLFTLAISILTGLLVGLLPAWRFANADPQEAMTSGSRATAGRGSSRLRSLLVGLEVGSSAMCLVIGGLLLHSFVKLLNVERGFEAERVVTIDLNLPGRYADREKKSAFLRSTLERVASIPGVTSAGISNSLPLSGMGGNTFLLPEGTSAPLAERPGGDFRMVSPDYFRTMGIPLRAGRIFEEADRKRQVAVVSLLAAGRLWPGENPIGKRFRIGNERGLLLEVAGVVGDVRGASLSTNPRSPSTCDRNHAIGGEHS